MPLYSGDKEYLSAEGTEEDFTLVFLGDCKWSVDSYTVFEDKLKPYTEEELICPNADEDLDDSYNSKIIKRRLKDYEN